MKKWIWIPILIILFILLSCQKKNTEEQFPIAQEVENKILSAMDVLKEGDADKGAELLLDAILLTKPSAHMPEGFENKIISAKNQFQGGDIDKGVELIS